MKNENLKNQIIKLAKNNLPEIIEWRRHIHSNPELSFKEYKTTDYIEFNLRKLGVTKIEKITETGLVALIEGKNPNSVVRALRADIDALPITEINTVDYKSSCDGIMHACGHDAHTASLLGTAAILMALKDQLIGSVKLIFQPAEEKMPGGASTMIKNGVLSNPSVKNMLGHHVYPFLKAGQLGFKKGMYMASCDEIYIEVKGKGGHAALPEKNIDTVLVASQVVVSLQQIVSRRASPKDPTVLSIGKFIANGATNVIPSSVFLEGTFRAMNEKWRAEALDLIHEITQNICKAYGAEAEVKIVKGYPYLENHPELTDEIRTLAEEFVGKENVVDLEIWMGAEDFSYYTHEVPACFYRFGTSSPSGDFNLPVHTANFNIDENALQTSAGFMAYTILVN